MNRIKMSAFLAFGSRTWAVRRIPPAADAKEDFSADDLQSIKAS